MEKYLQEYQRWLNSENLDKEIKTELLAIKDDEEEIEDRFYQELSFGTAGLRGKLGAGTNRMNKYVVARATFALAKVIMSYGKEYMDRGVAIAYDCRIKSDEFAMLCARIMATSGIKAYIFDSLRPTPQLSFAIRKLNCVSGINITASHNPKEYNGYKVYWEEGSQIKDDIADKVLEQMSDFDVLNLPDIISEKEARDKNLIITLGEDMDNAYYEKVLSLTLNDDIDKDITIVYTPLNGAGNIAVREVLKRRGFKNVHVVKEQENPDGTFPTVDYPNPEDLAAFEYANKLAKKVGADIIIATDPDSDRLAVEVMEGDDIISFNGNQMGVLMINYILSQKKEKATLAPNSAIVKSIVTGDMGTAIAKDYGVKMFDVLTGFKNICALPNDWDKTGKYEYVFGYEESIGYNPGIFVRDKDAVSSAMMLAEMAGFYKKQGKNLNDVLQDLFEKYGYYAEDTISITLEGIEGQQRIGRMMKEIRTTHPKNVNGSDLKEITDYQESVLTNAKTGEKSAIDIEKTNAVGFEYEDGCWTTLRPSGTEPKIKIYVYAKADTMEDAKTKVKNIQKSMKDTLDSIE